MASKKSTRGGSTTATSSHGGSSSTTVSNSVTDSSSHTEGGSHSQSFGKNWASGKVDEHTQTQFDKHNQDYVEGNKVNAAYDQLQQILNNKPKFESVYEDKLSGLYDQIMNREKFNYDFNADPMYNLYKDNYTQQGETAMEDTMGQASAMTGGYGSSYAQSVGQQTYQNYLQKLNQVIPELRNQAYQQYRDEGAELKDKYGITSDAYQREYGQHRDDVADWQADRGFQYGMYSDERNFDYNKHVNDRNYWQNEYWNEKNAERSNYQVTDTQNWSDTNTHSETNSTSTTNSSYWDASNSATNSWAAAPSGGGKTGGNPTKTVNNDEVNNFYNNNQSKTESNFVPYDISKNDNLAKYEQAGIVDDLVNQIRGASNTMELAQIYTDLETGFNFGGEQIKLTKAEIAMLRDKAFGNGTRW